MTLDDYMDELRWNVARFEEHWRAKNKEVPAQYPMTMESGDWDEQFVVFCGDPDSTPRND